MTIEATYSLTEFLTPSTSSLIDRVRDLIDFAPRAATPGGSVIMSDLQLYQPLMQTDWRHGFGHHWYDDAMGYMRTTGNIDTRHSDIAMLWTKATSSDTDNNAKEGFTIFNGALYAYGTGGLRKYSGGSWSSIYSSAAVNFALGSGNEYLFYCPDGGRIQKLSTSDVSSDTGLDANATDYKWLIIHNGYIYAGKDNSRRVHFSDASDLSDLEGTTADPNAIYVGSTEVPTIGAIVYAGNLYVSKADGLWHIGEDRIARKVVDMSGQFSSDNFRSMAIINGLLVFPIRDKIFQWNTARIADVTPNPITDTFPYITYGRFDNLIETQGFLYCTARTNQTTYEEHLLCWDGVGWHKLADLVTNGTDTISALGYDSVNNRLWYHLNATADATYYIPLQSVSDFPYADFSTTGTHSVISSRLDMGYRRVKKSMPSILVEASNVTAARKLNVYYSLDGGAWVSWGSVTSNGVTELIDPGGSDTQEFNYIQIRVDFVTDSATQSPILEGWTIRFIMRPDVLFGYNFNIIASTELERGRKLDSRQADDIVDTIRTLRDSKAPISFVDLLGDTKKVYISAMSEIPRERRAESSDGRPTIEYYINVNCVEIGV